MSPVSHRKQAMSSASDYNFSTTSSQVKDCRSIDEPGYAVLGAGIAAAQDGGCGGGKADPGVRSNKRGSGPGRHRSRREGWSSWYPHAGRCIAGEYSSANG